MSEDWLTGDPFVDPNDPAAAERERRRLEREQQRREREAEAEAEEPSPERRSRILHRLPRRHLRRAHRTGAL